MILWTHKIEVLSESLTVRAHAVVYYGAYKPLQFVSKRIGKFSYNLYI